MTKLEFRQKSIERKEEYKKWKLKRRKVFSVQTSFIPKNRYSSKKESKKRLKLKKEWKDLARDLETLIDQKSAKNL